MARSSVSPTQRRRSQPPAQSVELRRVPQQDRSRERVEAILRAARELIGERGADSVSTREIAVQARVPIASVYQYFPDKTAILRALTIRFYERMQAMLAQLLAALERREDVPAAIDMMIDGLVAEIGSARPHLNVWSAAQSNAVLRELDVRDSLILVDMLTERLHALAPEVDIGQVRNTCLFAVLTAGSVIRLSFVAPPDEGARLLTEFKALLRLRAASLLSAGAPPPGSSSA